jgi:DNA-directed RNA polymerase subunit RPC12/RpoP
MAYKVNDFECIECGNRMIDILHSQDEVIVCTECGSTDVTKLASHAGMYQTNFHDKTWTK